MKLSAIVFLLGCGALNVFAQSNPIDIEMVKKDLLAQDMRETPAQDVPKLKAAQFNIMYVGKLCFVHLPYKRYAGEAFMQQSDFLVYRLIDNQWTLETFTHSWYTMKLLDPTQPVFLSDVQYCDAKGKCQTYQSISHYDGKELFRLREYQGNDNSVYYDWLKSAGKPDDFKEAVNDTLYSNYKLTNFHVEEHQTSFTLNRKAAIVISISPTLVKSKVVIDNLQRVIANH